MPAAKDQAVCRHGDEQRAAHDEGEGGVPTPGYVEESYDFGRVHHPRDGEPEAEDDAATKSRENPKNGHQKACPVRKTVTIATPKNTAVAITERQERSARPHRPWPLVQPEPMRVPKPTSSPPIRIAGGDASTSTVAGPPATRI